jgi:hypothetical protein
MLRTLVLFFSLGSRTQTSSPKARRNLSFSLISVIFDISSDSFSFKALCGKWFLVEGECRATSSHSFVRSSVLGALSSP